MKLIRTARRFSPLRSHSSVAVYTRVLLSSSMGWVGCACSGPEAPATKLAPTTPPTEQNTFETPRANTASSSLGGGPASRPHAPNGVTAPTSNAPETTTPARTSSTGTRDRSSRATSPAPTTNRTGVTARSDASSAATATTSPRPAESCDALDPSASGDTTNGGDATDPTATDVPQRCPDTAIAQPGDDNRTVTVGTLERSYSVHVPPSYTGDEPFPVVIDFHPLGGSGASWRSASGWTSIADREGFIVVWPDGVGNSWNVGRCCSTASRERIDDVAFARAIIAQLAAEACVDASRVYATGCSNGGGMAYKVACDAADVIAAVAPVDFDCATGSSDAPSCGGCEPARPISAIQFRATSDFAVPYQGGAGPRGEVVFPGSEANLADWAELNGCVGPATPLAEQPACVTHSTCDEGVEATLCTVENGTHCGNYSSFGIVELAWERLRRSQLPD